MSDFFEFLFCPVHGLFRPDNLVGFIAIAQNMTAYLFVWLARIGIL